jgi:hypothetical protein
VSRVQRFVAAMLALGTVDNVASEADIVTYEALGAIGDGEKT